MIDMSRHIHIVKPWEHKGKITIIGAGATGSRVFMSLIELGFTNIDVYDFDTIEAHNLANQAYMFDDIGHAKVTGLANLYVNKTGEDVPDEMRLAPERVPFPGFEPGETVFLLTDTMSSRREIYETCLKDNLDVMRVIETRMASMFGNIFAFNPNNEFQAKAWEDTLISDDAPAELSPCGSPISVGMTASLIANYAVWQFIHMLTNPEAGADVHNVYFKPFCSSTRSL